MSTLLYQSLTIQREQSTPGTSTERSTEPKQGKPGVSYFVDTLAALIPAEVLAAHAVILGVVAERTDPAEGPTVLTIAQGNVTVAKWSWLGLAVAAALLYIGAHVRSGRANGRDWDLADFGRMLIPPAAFIAWTIVQKGTLFDGVFTWSDVTRTVAGVFLALLLVLVSRLLAEVADGEQPTATTEVSGKVVTAT